MAAGDDGGEEGGEEERLGYWVAIMLDVLPGFCGMT